MDLRKDPIRTTSIGPLVTSIFSRHFILFTLKAYAAWFRFQVCDFTLAKLGFRWVKLKAVVHGILKLRHLRNPASPLCIFSPDLAFLPLMNYSIVLANVICEFSGFLWSNPFNIFYQNFIYPGKSTKNCNPFGKFHRCFSVKISYCVLIQHCITLFLNRFPKQKMVHLGDLSLLFFIIGFWSDIFCSLYQYYHNSN